MNLPKLELVPAKSPLKIGDDVSDIEPNIFDDCILVDTDGSQVGLFIKKLPDDLNTLVNIADLELKSKRVPKSDMLRTVSAVKQYSTILGSIPIKPHLGRAYPSRSSVHGKKSANTFVKAMYGAGIKCFELVKKYIPDVASHHLLKIDERVPERWRFANNFTSTISNCNISAPIHQDHANVKGAINMIITKRRNSKGGNLHVPDFNATFDQTDNSLLVYPAWRNRHGVTPIIPTYQDGYRNSHVWYSLDSFHSLDDKKKVN